LISKSQLRQQLKEAIERIDFLEKENGILRAELARLSDIEANNIELTAKITRLEYTVSQLLKHRFGSKSERYEDGDDPQLALFSELIKESNDNQNENGNSDSSNTGQSPNPDSSNDKDFGNSNGEGKPDTNKPRREYKKRITYPEDIQRDVVEYDLPNHLRNCHCGADMPVIGYSSNDVIHYTPESFSIIEERFLKRACGCKECIRTALVPKRVLPRVMVTNELLAQIVISKCLDRQPTYHIEQRWESRHGMIIPRDNMIRWSNKLSKQLQPIYNLIQDQFSDYDIGSLDATWLQVLKEDGREPQTKSKAWCFVGGNPETPVVLFEYCADNHVGFLTEKLEDFKGYLHGDADNAYTSFHKKNIKLVYCNAHNRRHYVPIAEKSKSEGIAQHVLKEYQKLYAIESQIKDLTPKEKKAIRIMKAKPILDALYIYLVNRFGKTPPKSLLGEAMAYSIKYWKGLTRYLDDGRLSIDNNHTERIIRKFVMARNNVTIQLKSIFT
jgi:transposase